MQKAWVRPAMTKSILLKPQTTPQAQKASHRATGSAGQQLTVTNPTSEISRVRFSLYKTNAVSQ